MMKNKEYGFYYNMMTEHEKVIYRRLCDGFRKCKREFYIPECEQELLSDIYEKVTLDCPEIFYLKTIEIETRIGTKGYMIRPIYRFIPEEIQYVLAEVDKQIRLLIPQCEGKTDGEKEKLIHDYIVSKVSYKDLNAAYSHEMPGVFLYGIGVCEGISKAFKFLCDAVGLKSGVVVGKIKEEPVAHAWNVVQLNGSWYNIDVTFDANLSQQAEDIRYDYFNVADYELAERRSFYMVPACSKYYGYYKKENMYAHCQNELKRLIKSRKGNLISLQIPRLDCSIEQLKKYIMETVFDGIRGIGNYKISICPNYDMNVFTVKVEKGKG